MIQIYHNPRCRKSREGLEILNNSGKTFEVIEYLKTPLSVGQLTTIISLLKMHPIELVRKNEPIWKENYKGKEMSNSEIIEVLASHPKLIERPIVVHNNNAIVGRPPEKIVSIL